MVEHWDGSSDWGDFEYNNQEWENAITRYGIPPWVADAADANDVPPPSEWVYAQPWVDTEVGYGFEIEAEGGTRHWVWAGEWSEWQELWGILRQIDHIEVDTEVGSP